MLILFFVIVIEAIAIIYTLFMLGNYSLQTRYKVIILPFYYLHVATGLSGKNKRPHVLLYLFSVIIFFLEFLLIFIRD